MKACTGCFLPFTMNGSSATVLNATDDASRTGPVARICPGTAIDITRAARFTASPITVYVRRYAGPMSPAKTGPLFTPIRTGTVVSASMIDAEREQHPALVVPEGVRRTGHEDDLPAVVVDVGAEERDTVAPRPRAGRRR